jgi:hypothetical protein
MKPAIIAKFLAIFLIVSSGACARFQPTEPVPSTSNYSLSALQQSATLKDPSIRYDPAVLHVGAGRNAVEAAYGDPNESRTRDNGFMEDVYAFNPDGTKFVNPQVRARNVALGFLTLGASVGVRQARLYLQERKLTLFHVIYSPADRIESVTVEKLSGAPDTLPAVGSGYPVNAAQ